MSNGFQYFLFFIILCGSSCISSSSIYVEVLSPSTANYTKPIKKIFIINNIPEKDNRLNRDSVVNQAAKSWAENFASEITKYNISDSVIYLNKPLKYNKKDTSFSDFTVNINNINIQLTCSENNSINTIGNPKCINLDYNFDYYVSYSIYDTKTQKQIIQNTQTNTKRWSELYKINDSIVSKAENRIEIALLTINQLGKEASYIFFSEWKRVKRNYYTNHYKDDLILAEYYASVNEWKKAAEIWSKYTQSYIHEKKYFQYNMAFASEMEGNLDAALFWIKKASEVYFNRKAVKYQCQLEERIEEQYKLIEQLGSPK